MLSTSASTACDQVNITNDSGFMLEKDMEVMDTDEDDMVPSPQKKKQSRKKPSRKCIFCGEFQACLSRHIRRNYKTEGRVKEVLTLPRKMQNEAFSNFRKEGILKANMDVIKEENPAFHRERAPIVSSSLPMVVCGGCKGFFAKTFFPPHKKSCKDSCPPTAIKISMIADETTQNLSGGKFQQEILGTMRDDNAGTKCKSDPCHRLVPI